jgi:acetoin utilization deacetylase AcuC-like enzyme
VEELAAVHDMNLIKEVAAASKLQQEEMAAAAQTHHQQQQHAPSSSPLHTVAAAESQLKQQYQQQQQQERPALHAPALPAAAAAAEDAAAAGISHGAELGALHILDCYIGPATYSCAAKAAGAAIDVAVAVARGQAPAGAAIIRPPGHHAEGGLAMGFCYFNNAAVAARAAQREAGVRRVLILDWDVHHGNGTQAIFEDDADVMYMSIHR